MKKNYFLILLCCAGLFSACEKASNRQIISLNGEWQIAQTAGELPEGYPSVTQVPGLVDMAVPALDAGDTHKNGWNWRNELAYRDTTLDKGSWYWHRRTLTLKNTGFEKIILKIFKARYHTKVYVNGQFVGENLYCYTPSYFDIKPFLAPAGQANEIVIGVGNQRELPDTIPDGNDFEKLKFIPGIYDNVEITLSNKPYINNIQCVPDVVNEKLRVVAEIETDNPEGLTLIYQVSELVSKKTVAKQSISPKVSSENGITKVDFEIDMRGAKLWSPESPFLYNLTLSTDADDKTVRFGMRSFRFDIEKGVALLNEKPYYMRGTNVCTYRFFEDPERATLPWDAQWPVTLHERFKGMYWNTMRYTIGFPPERWYEICDSLGLMLQDEYPIWGIKGTVQPAQIAEEYARWMRERWNHPSVVIWDAQNETITLKTGEAINAVRHLDLSNRPWENGWSAPMAKTDPVESHPYRFIDYNKTTRPEPKEGYKKELMGKMTRDDNDAGSRWPDAIKSGNPFDNLSIVNEYGWVWLNRNGTTTTLTDSVYDNLWGKNLNSAQRLEIYARHLAMLTEYWRAHRQAVGVLHFCGLGYSRPEEPRGQTSDHWVNLQKLTFETEFYKYVKPAFAPVGLMVDLWEKAYTAGAKVNVPVYVINDLGEPAVQNLKLTLLKDGQEVGVVYEKNVTVKPYQVEIVPFEVTLPTQTGNYLLKAEITVNGEQVFSLRDIPLSEP